jgi:hypothetical protein
MKGRDSLTQRQRRKVGGRKLSNPGLPRRRRRTASTDRLLGKSGVGKDEQKSDKGDDIRSYSLDFASAEEREEAGPIVAAHLWDGMRGRGVMQVNATVAVPPPPHTRQKKNETRKLRIALVDGGW